MKLERTDISLNGNFTFTETFTEVHLITAGGSKRCQRGFISTTAEGLTITPYETNIKAVLPTSTLFYRQQHFNFTATTTLKYVPRTEKTSLELLAIKAKIQLCIWGNEKSRR